MHASNSLPILELPLHFTFPLENKEVKIDETVTLSCELSKPGQEVTWLRNNVPISLSDEHFEIVNKDCSYQLHIGKITQEDKGDYQVRIGELECSAKVTVMG